MFGATIETRMPGACDGRSSSSDANARHVVLVGARGRLHRHESADPTLVPERRAVDLVSEQSHSRAGTGRGDALGTLRQQVPIEDADVVRVAHVARVRIGPFVRVLPHQLDVGVGFVPPHGGVEHFGNEVAGAEQDALQLGDLLRRRRLVKPVALESPQHPTPPSSAISVAPEQEAAAGSSTAGAHHREARTLHLAITGFAPELRHCLVHESVPVGASGGELSAVRVER